MNRRYSRCRWGAHPPQLLLIIRIPRNRTGKDLCLPYLRGLGPREGCQLVRLGVLQRWSVQTSFRVDRPRRVRLLPKLDLAVPLGRLDDAVGIGVTETQSGSIEAQLLRRCLHTSLHCRIGDSRQFHHRRTAL